MYNTPTPYVPHYEIFNIIITQIFKQKTMISGPQDHSNVKMITKFQKFTSERGRYIILKFLIFGAGVISGLYSVIKIMDPMKELRFLF